ncbi:hypothetical protein MASR2M15_21180 [Anaerolineales bacterium]
MDTPMPKMLYLSMMRLPSEKAHALQIVQNCEAFADAGYEVELWASMRFNTPAMKAVKNIHQHYGVQANFRIRRNFGLDLMPLAFSKPKLEQIAFYIHSLTYCFVLLLRLLFTDADLFYSRDPLVLRSLAWIKPKHKLVYEAHLFPKAGRGANLQAAVLKKCAVTVAITPPLRDALIQRGADPARILVAHDGIRAARFAHALSPSAARLQAGWPADLFIVGFVGRLHMIGMDKGIDTLIQALATLQDPQIALALVGGPDDMALAYRQQWLQAGLSEAHFLYAGQVPPDAVPDYLATFDVCAMPHPHTQQYAYYTSPLKLFEYMASQRPLIASDLPAWSDVIENGQNGLLFPAGDAPALATALQKLKTDPAFGQQLAANAYQTVMQRYTWAARARLILDFIEKQTP